MITTTSSREYTIDFILIEEHIKKLEKELDFYCTHFYFDRLRHDGSYREEDITTIEIAVGGELDLEDLEEPMKLMKRIDKKFGENVSYLIASDKASDAILVRFDISVKEVLHD